jgi:flagellar biogenesis protein FliO
MSLKAFHIVFVTASILLALLFGVWSLVNYFQGGVGSDLLFGVGSLVAMIALIFYEKYALKKLKNISYL